MIKQKQKGTYQPFLTAWARSKESLSVPAATLQNLEPIPPLLSFNEHHEQKDEILNSPASSTLE